MKKIKNQEPFFRFLIKSQYIHEYIWFLFDLENNKEELLKKVFFFSHFFFNNFFLISWFHVRSRGIILLFNPHREVIILQHRC